MRHLYTRWLLVMWVMILSVNLAAAQITLHEATDITQTKATLSADFPDLNAEHGFQYKYGTLPEIDEFSKTALHPLSDPVQIITSGNVWSVRTVKGWVESNSNLSVGQTSVMSANVKLSEPTIITFDWSVDSEESIGILSFIVDDETVQEISGAVDFTEVSYQATAGEHTLQWQYKKTAATNVGLDLGMVRNINLQNTTEGEWITKISPTSEFQLSNLYPEQNHIYRAFAGKEYSCINYFKTNNIQIDNPVVITKTQTTATISTPVDYGDMNAECSISLSKETPMISGLLKYPTPWITISKSFGDTGTELSISTNRSGGYVECTFCLSETSKISFEAYCTGSGRIEFSIDENHIVNIYGSKYNRYEYEVPEGKHTLKWYSKHTSHNGVFHQAHLRNLEIPNITPEDDDAVTNYYITDVNAHSSLKSLTPNSNYYIRTYIHPNYENDLPTLFTGKYSNWISFTTLPVTTEILPVTTIKQASATIRGKVDSGDATIISTGLQYKDATGTRWTDYPKEITEIELSHNITRLKPNTTYNYRSYIQAQDCDTIFSEIGEFTTLAVKALKPTVIKLAQHEATLQGKVSFGDANIYQRGMQFRKKGDSSWDEVEDAGNDSIFTLVKKDLEIGTTYEARTYMQPAGCDVMYSDILEFTTLDTYFTSCNSNDRTQTTITFEATLADLDENIVIDQYGFEYYIDSDGFFEDAENFEKSEIYDIPAIPNDKKIKATVTGLFPYSGIRWRAYAIINGTKVYYTSYKNWTWDFAGTDRAVIKVDVANISQTSISLRLDASQAEGDAVISQIEYALANSVNDTKPYSICGNTLTINNLTPNTQYNIRFRGLVNNHYCPLLKDVSWDYSWFEYKTLPVDVNVQFSDITQTKANMKVEVNAGDASISNLRYSVNYGEILECSSNNLLSNLTPGQTYTVTIYANVNGEEMSWSSNISDKPFKFTTKSVTSNLSISDITQTAARCNWSSNYGDATFVASGVEIGSVTYDFTEDSGEELLSELLPNTSYSCRSYVQTVEGGTVYSSVKNFTTKSISCETFPVSNISNRSATMNGTIDCDSFSSADFGFQWKQMEGWNSDPAFTKGRKLDDGTISVALVNGMLEPNTDYQYRTAVRYQGNLYTASEWQTFRTESEFVYYPASVYTIFRTDRENNSLILCGYYVAGSESVISQGYEYWRNDGQSMPMRAAQTHVVVNTDESMQHVFTPGELADGSYSVRAFVKTESGKTTYGSILQFTSSNEGYFSSLNEDIMLDHPAIIVENNTVKIYNSANNDCYVYGMDGILIDHRKISSDYEEMHLNSSNYYIIKTSNGLIKKVRL